VWYADADGDGFGDPKTAAVRCEALAGEVENGEDCADGDAAVHPAAGEVCDGVDQDCDGLVDNDAVDAVPWFLDLDEDGFGSLKAGVACTPPPGGALQDGDCNDEDPAAYPGAEEWACDQKDTDCDGLGTEMAAAWHRADGVAPGFPTIQAAIDAAPDGGSVEVCPGSWTESLAWSKSLILRGDPELRTEIRAATVRAVRAEGTRVALIDLVLVGGTSTDDLGGGVAWVASELLAVEGVVVEGGESEGDGGGLAWWGTGSSPKLTARDATFRDNVADTQGGGLYTSSGAAYVVELDGVTFEDNTVGYSGGGLEVSTSGRGGTDPVEIVVRNSRFVDNVAGYEGGGLSAGGWGLTTLEVEDTTFEGNLAGWGGGGASAGGRASATAVFTRVTFDGNIAASAGGAAVKISGDGENVVTYDTCTVQGNTGGAALSSDGRGQVETWMTGGSVIDNEAGISMERSDVLTLEDVDLGAGTTDNASYDVQWGTMRLRRDGLTSLRCDGAGCR
jgi:predicted outer membrane repeat protein